MGIIMRNGVSYSGIPTDIESIDFTSSSVGGTTPSQPGATDTYTIALSNGATSAFTVYNGADGKDSPTNSDVIMEGNPVILTDLQGEVPFSKITINGEGIVGQEITLTTTGKNQLPITLTDGTGAGLTYTVDNDEITVSGTTTDLATIIVSAPNMTITQDMRLSYRGTLSGITPKATVLRNGELVYPTPNETIGSKLLAGDVLQNVYIQQQEAGIEVSGSARFQLEYGTAVTEYEAYSGETYTVTPDSTEYIVPTNIIQNHGINVIAVGTTDATLSVIGVGANNAIAKLWNNTSYDDAEIRSEIAAEATARAEADSALQTKIDAIDLTPYAKTTALSAETAARTTAINKMQTEIETITLRNPVIMPTFNNLISSKKKVYTHTMSATGASEGYSRCGCPVYGNDIFMKILSFKPSSSARSVYAVWMSSDGGTTWESSGKSWTQYNGSGSGVFYTPNKLYFMNGQFVTVGYKLNRSSTSTGTYTRPWICYSIDGTSWINATEIANNTLGAAVTCVYKDGKYVYSTANGYILSSTNHDDVASVTRLATADIFLALCGDTIIALAETGEVYTSPMSTMSDTSWTQMTTVGTDLTMKGLFSDDTVVVAYGTTEVWYSTDCGANWYAAIDNTTSAQLNIDTPYGCYVPELYDYKFFLCDTDRIHMSFDGKKWDKYTATTYIEGLTYDENALVIGVKGGVYRSEDKELNSVALEDIINYILINSSN